MDTKEANNLREFFLASSPLLLTDDTTNKIWEKLREGTEAYLTPDGAQTAPYQVWEAVFIDKCSNSPEFLEWYKKTVLGLVYAILHTEIFKAQGLKPDIPNVTLTQDEADSLKNSATTTVKEVDIVSMFLKEKAQYLGPEETKQFGVKPPELYVAFVEWCNSSKTKILALSQFYNRMRVLGHSSMRVDKNQRYPFVLKVEKPAEEPSFKQKLLVALRGGAKSVTDILKYMGEEKTNRSQAKCHYWLRSFENEGFVKSSPTFGREIHWTLIDKQNQ
jgi:hypothetical protein